MFAPTWFRAPDLNVPLVAMPVGPNITFEISSLQETCYNNITEQDKTNLDQFLLNDPKLETQIERHINSVPGQARNSAEIAALIANDLKENSHPVDNNLLLAWSIITSLIYAPFQIKRKQNL